MTTDGVSTYTQKQLKELYASSKTAIARLGYQHGRRYKAGPWRLEVGVGFTRMVVPYQSCLDTMPHVSGVYTEVL